MGKILSIKDLSVRVARKRILENINLEIDEGEVFALIGPNGCGKTTLAYSIMGIPTIKVEKGKIIFQGKDITRLSVEKRARLGIALAFQNPPPLEGILLKDLLQLIGKKKVEFDLVSHLLEREVNVGFSGGEKKISELIQIISMKPKLAILDEIDSGLDIKKLEKVIRLIERELIQQGSSVILITHRPDILRKLKPQRVGVMLDGKIICISLEWKKVWKSIKRWGYEGCRRCKLLVHRS